MMKTNHSLILALVASTCAFAFPACSSDEPESQASSPPPRTPRSSGEPTDLDPTKWTKNVGEAQKKTREQRERDGAIQEDAVEDMFGKMDLKAWPSLTPESIAQKLDPSVVQKIIGVEHELKVEKGKLGPEAKYKWKGPNRESGEIRITIPMQNRPIAQMKVQAGVRRNSVKAGRGKEIGLGEFGAIGIWRLKENGTPIDLQICTGNSIIIIKTSLMRGRDFEDREAIMKAGTELARAMFQAHRE